MLLLPDAQDADQLETDRSGRENYSHKAVGVS